MEKAKLFQNGNSQAVRLPKEFRMPGNEVKIYKKGNQIIIEPLETTWDALFESLAEFPEDFMEEGRNQPAVQNREAL
ncbi:MAG: type II toxin-antitoxin system VapB family antitoxin [Desulfovermiculus sp.]|jgi:antitoxin VapB|nr:type II toxin-antitoxin system VapB family antitoxin [Desulfovermiculus sp.]